MIDGKTDEGLETIDHRVGGRALQSMIHIVEYKNINDVFVIHRFIWTECTLVMSYAGLSFLDSKRGFFAVF